jgi:hypothetical protein
MADDNVLNFLRARFAQLDTRLEAIEMDVRSLKDDMMVIGTILQGMETLK